MMSEWVFEIDTWLFSSIMPTNYAILARFHMYMQFWTVKASSIKMSLPVDLGMEFLQVKQV